MAADVVDPKREQFLALAEAAFERMFGADGQNGLVTFAEREQRACEVTDELARWMMAEHVALDPAGQPGVEARCPICQAGARGRGSVHGAAGAGVDDSSRQDRLPSRGGPLPATVGGFFSLLDERLALGTEGYSAALLAKIEYAGANQAVVPEGGRDAWIARGGVCPSATGTCSGSPSVWVASERASVDNRSSR